MLKLYNVKFFLTQGSLLWKAPNNVYLENSLKKNKFDIDPVPERPIIAYSEKKIGLLFVFTFLFLWYVTFHKNRYWA